MTEKNEPNLRAVPAVTRAVHILKYLETAGEPVGVNRLARELALVPSTCLHILRVLAEHDLVAVVPATKRYRLGIGILSLARSFLRENTFASSIQPVLEEFARQHNVTAVAVERTTREKFMVVAVANGGGADLFTVRITIGSSFPALSSASGRCFAAFCGWSEEEMRRRFAQLRWDNPPTFECWRKDVRAVRDQGYACDVGNYNAGVTAVSVPILDESGTVKHCLAIAGFKDQLRGKRLKALSQGLIESASALQKL